MSNRRDNMSLTTILKFLKIKCWIQDTTFNIFQNGEESRDTVLKCREEPTFTPQAPSSGPTGSLQSLKQEPWGHGEDSNPVLCFWLKLGRFFLQTFLLFGAFTFMTVLAFSVISDMVNLLDSLVNFLPRCSEISIEIYERKSFDTDHSCGVILLCGFESDGRNLSMS